MTQKKEEAEAKKEADEVQAHVDEDNSGTNAALDKVKAHLAEQVADIAGSGLRVQGLDKLLM